MNHHNFVCILSVILLLTANYCGVYAQGTGEFTIAGIFDVCTNSPCSSCRANPQIGVHLLEAFRFAILKANTLNLLYGFKLKEFIANVDNEKKLGDSILDCFFYGHIVISTVEAQMHYTVSLFRESLDIPVISQADSGTRGKADDTQFQMTPNEKFRLSAAVNVIKGLGWDYVTIITSSGRVSKRISSLFEKHIGNFNICHAKSFHLPATPSTADYEEMVRGANATSAVGLALVTNLADSEGIAKAMRKLSLRNRFQILALSGFSNYIEITKGNEAFIEGAISIEHTQREIPDFRNHFLSLKGDKDRRLRYLWANIFNCTVPPTRCRELPDCSGKEKLKVNQGYYPDTPVNYVINAVFSYAIAIKKFIEWKCNNKPPCKIDKKNFFPFVRHFLAKNTFEDKTINITDPITGLNPSIVSYDILNYIRTERGFENKIAGTWTFERSRQTFSIFNASYLPAGNLTWTAEVVWTTTTRNAVSSCRLPCHVGEIWEANARMGECCRMCVPCKENEITANNSCVDCGTDNRPDSRRKTCIPFEVRYFGNDPTSKRAILAYMGLLAIGVTVTLFFIFIFIKFNGNKLVRASGRDLCYVILCGICLLFLSPVGFLLAPSRAVCVSRDIIPGIAFCMCYSPLFLKTNRIYRIFCNAQTTVAKPQMISPQSQLLLLLNIMGVQVLLSVVWVLGKVKKITEIYDRPNGIITHHCSNRALSLVLNLLLSVFFMCCCTWYAFKTRNFPKNYNESKYIAFTMYLTFIAWAVFLPTYFSADERSFAHDHLICATLIAAAFVTLFGLFGQKVQILVFPTRAQRERQASDVSRQEADPNQFQMQSHKLNTLSLQRGIKAAPGQRRFTATGQDF